MGFFDFLKQANINQGIEEYKRTAGAEKNSRKLMT